LCILLCTQEVPLPQVAVSSHTCACFPPHTRTHSHSIGTYPFQRNNEVVHCPSKEPRFNHTTSSPHHTRKGRRPTWQRRSPAETAICASSQERACYLHTKPCLSHTSPFPSRNPGSDVRRWSGPDANEFAVAFSTVRFPIGRPSQRLQSILGFCQRRHTSPSRSSRYVRHLPVTHSFRES